MKNKRHKTDHSNTLRDIYFHWYTSEYHFCTHLTVISSKAVQTAYQKVLSQMVCWSQDTICLPIKLKVRRYSLTVFPLIEIYMYMYLFIHSKNVCVCISWRVFIQKIMCMCISWRVFIGRVCFETFFGIIKISHHYSLQLASLKYMQFALVRH